MPDPKPFDSTVEATLIDDSLIRIDGVDILPGNEIVWVAGDELLDEKYQIVVRPGDRGAYITSDRPEIPLQIVVRINELTFVCDASKVRASLDYS